MNAKGETNWEASRRQFLVLEHERLLKHPRESTWRSKLVAIIILREHERLIQASWGVHGGEFGWWV